MQTAHRITKRFGLAVRRVRCERGISQEELGYRASLHRTYIGDIECGRRNATLLSAQRIADALQIPLSELIRIAESLNDE